MQSGPGPTQNQFLVDTAIPSGMSTKEKKGTSQAAVTGKQQFLQKALKNWGFIIFSDNRDY